MPHLFLVAVEHQRRTPARFADALLRGLAPTRMIHVRIDVGVKAVFVRGILAPRCARLRCHQFYFYDGFDALETVFPRRDQPDGRAILRRQRAAINAARQQRQRVHRLVHPQTLDIRPVQHVAALTRHPLGIQQRLERDELCAARRLDHIEKFGQRETRPRNHHGPAFNAAHSINALFRGTDFQ